MTGMVIAIIGGAGVRTPLLVRGLAQSGLPLSEVRVFDKDGDRLRLIAPLIERVAGVRIVVKATVAECVAGATFVIVF